ncbi:hypothetical protein TNCV_1217891 [Trichonephila clavipes]|nr:hypothetical protein TNCV_1217891 [Trichonephila clavipes]
MGYSNPARGIQENCKSHLTGSHHSTQQSGVAMAVGVNCTNCDVEVIAVQLALTEISIRCNQNIGIFLDFDANIKIISSLVLLSINGPILCCPLLINYLMDSGRKVTLQWIPSHRGIIGKKFADTLAKEDTDPPVCYQSAKRIIFAKFKAPFQEKIRDSVLPRNRSGTEQNCTVTCLVLKAAANDRRKILDIEGLSGGSINRGVLGSLVVKVTDWWSVCHEFQPSTAEDPPCRGTMHVKSAIVPPMMRWGSLEREMPSQALSSSLEPPRGPLPKALE